MERLEDIFDKMDEEELTELLEGIRGEKPDAGTRKRLLRRVLPGRQRNRRRRLTAALAASLALACLALAGGYAAAEARAYSEAAAFFEEYDLDMEGLTRAEIKAVYRDITTNSFTYAKTAQVIGESAAKNTVGGWSIAQEEPTAEEMRILWEQIRSGGWGARRPGVSYKVAAEETMDGEGTPHFVSNRLEKYEDGELVWESSPITQFYISGWQEVSGGVVVYGKQYEETPAQRQYAATWLAKLDEQGRFVWTRPLPSGEDVREVVELEDGSLSIFSDGAVRGEGAYVWYGYLSRVGAGGEPLSSKNLGAELADIRGAAQLGEGYLLLLGCDRLVRLDARGELLGDVSYAVEGKSIVLNDVLAVNGRVYLSAYAVPEESDDYGREELDPILSYIFDGGHLDIESEELTPMVRERYTAMLLICDPDTGGASSFYEVPGSLGGELSAGENGTLNWDVESIASTFFSPVTNSFTIGGSCQVYRYAFAPDGTLQSREKTGEVTVFRR